METYTLFQAEKFLIFIISLYGFNESNATLKVYNRIIRVVAYVVLFLLLLYVLVAGRLCLPAQGTLQSSEPRYFFFEKLFFGANLACTLYCHFRKRKFDALLEVLKRYRVSQKLTRRIRNWNIFLALFAAPIYVIWLNRSRVKLYSTSTSDIAHGIVTTYIGTLLVHSLPLCSLPVLLSIYYINHAINERMEKIKKCASPLRRARLTTRLIIFSTRLNPLVKASNDYGASLMFLLKASANILNVILVYVWLSDLTRNGLGDQLAMLASDVPPLLFFFIYVCFLRVAPSANQIPSLMARVMMENMMCNEQVMSRDPISRIQLIKARLVHLNHLTHSNFNQEQFTVLVAPADQEDIFMVFVEIVDN